MADPAEAAADAWLSDLAGGEGPGLTEARLVGTLMGRTAHRPAAPVEPAWDMEAVEVLQARPRARILRVEARQPRRRALPLGRIAAWCGMGLAAAMLLQLLWFV